MLCHLSFSLYIISTVTDCEYLAPESNIRMLVAAFYFIQPYRLSRFYFTTS